MVDLEERYLPSILIVSVFLQIERSGKKVLTLQCADLTENDENCFLYIPLSLVFKASLAHSKMGSFFKKKNSDLRIYVWKYMRTVSFSFSCVIDET